MNSKERAALLVSITAIETDGAFQGRREMLQHLLTLIESFTAESATWTMRDGTTIRIADMDDDHLQKCERAIEAGTAPSTEEQAANITAERERRGLKRLKPMKENRAQISAALTTLLAMFRVATKDDRRHAFRAVATFLRDGSRALNQEDFFEVAQCADVLETMRNFSDARLEEGAMPEWAQEKLGSGGDVIVGIDPGVAPVKTGSLVAVTVKNGKLTSLAPIHDEIITEFVPSGTDLCTCGHTRDMHTSAAEASGAPGPHATACNDYESAPLGDLDCPCKTFVYSARNIDLSSLLPSSDVPDVAIKAEPAEMKNWVKKAPRSLPKWDDSK